MLLADRDLVLLLLPKGCTRRSPDLCSNPVGLLAVVAVAWVKVEVVPIPEHGSLWFSELAGQTSVPTPRPLLLGLRPVSVVVEVPIHHSAVDQPAVAESMQKVEGPHLVQATTSEKFLSRSANVQYYAATLRSRSEKQIPMPLHVLLRQPVQNDVGEVAPRSIL